MDRRRTDLYSAGMVKSRAQFGEFALFGRTQTDHGVYGQTLTLPILTTTERNAISGPADGMLIYNSTDNKFQGRVSGTWTNLH